MKPLLQSFQILFTLLGVGALVKTAEKILESPGYTDCFGFRLLIYISLGAFILSLINSNYLYKKHKAGPWNIVAPLLLLIALITLILSKNLDFIYIYEEQMVKTIQECKIFPF
jgi:hypothetical protein